MTDHRTPEHDAWQASDDGMEEGYSVDCTTCLLGELKESVDDVERTYTFASDTERTAEMIRRYSRIAHLASRLSWIDAAGLANVERRAKYLANAVTRSGEQ